jgi:hypothetical protein
MTISGADYCFYSTTPVFEIIDEFYAKLRTRWSSFIVDDSNFFKDRPKDKYLELFFSKDEKMDNAHTEEGFHLDENGEGCFMLMADNKGSTNLEIFVKEQAHDKDSAMRTMAFDSKLLAKNLWVYSLVLPDAVEGSPFCKFIMDTLIGLLENSIGEARGSNAQ